MLNQPNSLDERTATSLDCWHKDVEMKYFSLVLGQDRNFETQEEADAALFLRIARMMRVKRL
jgi:hypothetical protein